MHSAVMAVGVVVGGIPCWWRRARAAAAMVEVSDVVGRWSPHHRFLRTVGTMGPRKIFVGIFVLVFGFRLAA